MCVYVFSYRVCVILSKLSHCIIFPCGAWVFQCIHLWDNAKCIHAEKNIFISFAKRYCFYVSFDV